jgi:hypothetical protein
MSFIPPRNVRLFEMSISRRQELSAFLFLVTLWALAVSIFGNLAFTIFSDKFEWWAQRNRWEASAIVGASIVLLSFAALAALASGVMGGLRETRRFHIVLPVILREQGAGIAPIQGYLITKEIQKTLAKEDPARLKRACSDATAAQPGRPFVGELYELLASAVGLEMVRGIAKSCAFLLSKNAEFHGVDYSMLATPPGPCPKSEVAGMHGISMHLPAGCAAQAGFSERDRFGKIAPCLQIATPYGRIEFGIKPQWAILSPGYNHLSMRHAMERMGPEAQGCAHRAGVLPSLWVLEIPVEVRAEFSAGRTPLRFLRPVFEHFASWVCDVLDRTENMWSWEAFVERDIELEMAEGRDEGAGSTD